MSSDIVNFFGVMMSLLTVGLLGYGGVVVIGGLRSRFKRSEPPPLLDPDEIEAIRQQLDEMDHLKARIAELEERVDFAERLLSRSPATHQLPGSSS